MKLSTKISSEEFDAIREIGNVGVGNAATALSKLLNKKIEIRIPDTRFIPLKAFGDVIGGAERIVVALYLNISGDVFGECIFMFKEEEALKLVDLLMGQESGTSKTMNELEMSAFKEMSNIFTGSYLNALADMLEMKIIPSVPSTATDMAQAVIDIALIKLGKTSEELLCVKTSIDIEGHDINGEFMMIFEEESLRTIIKALNKKYGISIE